MSAGPPTDGWVRLHPLTPLLKGGRFGLLLLALLGQQGVRGGTSVRTTALLLGVGIPLGVLFGFIAWRAMRYRVTDGELQVESGVLTRRSRRVPLARLQAVDVVRPLYARVLGLAELRLEVVGGGDAEAPLAFLGDDDATRLRTRLLDLAAGRPAGPAGPAVAVPAPEHVLVAVPSGTLVASVLLGPPVVVAALLLLATGIVAVVDLETAGGVLLGAVPLLLGVGSFAVRRLLGEYGFTVAESPDGLRLRQGLLDTRSQTIPPGRIQVVRVLEPLLWRPFGWVRVEVDVAGYSNRGNDQQVTGALLPVAPRDLADRLVARVLGAALPPADRHVPERARWLAPLSRRRLAVGLDGRHLVASSGVLTTTTDVVPLAKVQSLRLVQGPLQRRLRLASLAVDTAGRRLPGALAPHRGDADALLAEVATLARQARLATAATLAPSRAGPPGQLDRALEPVPKRALAEPGQSRDSRVSPGTAAP